MKTSLFAGGVDSLPVAEQESNAEIPEGEKDPSTSTRTRQVYLVKKKKKKWRDSVAGENRLSLKILLKSTGSQPIPHSRGIVG